MASQRNEEITHSCSTFWSQNMGAKWFTKIGAKGPKTAPNPSKEERRKEQEGRTEEKRRQPNPWSEATRGRSGPPQSHSNARRTKEGSPPPQSHSNARKRWFEIQSMKVLAAKIGRGRTLGLLARQCSINLGGTVFTNNGVSLKMSQNSGAINRYCSGPRAVCADFERKCHCGNPNKLEAITDFMNTCSGGSLYIVQKTTRMAYRCLWKPAGTIKHNIWHSNDTFTIPCSPQS